MPASITAALFFVFRKMSESKTPSWSSKKSLLLNLGEGRSFLESLSQTLMNGKSLTDDEQEVYDTVTLDSIGEKEDSIKKALAEQVEEGR